MNGFDGPRNTSGRMKWSEKMNNNLIECKQRAKHLAASENPPLKPDGKRKGYMQLMKEFWDDKGYANLQLSCQNLRDQAARIEKSLGNVQDVIRRNIRREERIQKDSTNEDLSNVESESLFIQPNKDTDAGVEQSNLHEESFHQSQENIGFATTNTQVNEILDLAQPIFDLIVTSQGDFSNRTIDTRTKEKPTCTDINNINDACSLLLLRQRNNTESPRDDPFHYLWLVNCVLYAVVAAFLLNKGWKKISAGKKRSVDKDKDRLESQVKEIRRKLSIAQAEMDRIKKNQKITKKGKRNRKILLNYCKTISVAELVNFMEKEKSNLRKLKKVFSRKKKNEQARKLNIMFQKDPRRIYSSFNEMISNQSDEERPKFQQRQEEQSNTNLFENIDQAASYWKELWESDGTGDVSVKWLEGIKQAINEYVSEPSEEECTIDYEHVKKVISKKRNWSAPGPDRVVNYWWKKAESLHEGVASSFQEIGRGNCEIPIWFTEGKSSLIQNQESFPARTTDP